MSRMTTPSNPQQATQVKVPHEKIAQRAYEKWVKRGRPHGSNEQDWMEAEAELKTELSRSATGLSQTNRR